MARARSLKPGLFKNEILGVADPIYTIAFQGLWILADREGRLEDRPLRIKAEIIPYRDGIKMDDVLYWLQENEFIVRYEVDNKKYIQVNNFAKHQNPHCKESASDIPAPVLQGASTVHNDVFDVKQKEYTQQIENKQESYSTVQARCENSSKTSDSLNPEPLTFNPIPKESESRDYAFCGDVIKLNHSDFSKWKLLYPNVDLLYELKRLDLEFQHQKPKNWFITASQKINYQNKQARTPEKINKVSTRPSNPAGFVVVNG